MKMLSRDEILGAKDLRLEPVDVPEWGGRIFVRPLTAEESDKFQRDPDALENLTARMVAYCAVNEGGGRLFVDNDIAALAGKSAAAMRRVVAAIGKVNAMTVEAREDIRKN